MCCWDIYTYSVVFASANRCVFKYDLRWFDRAQELCESRGGRPGLPVPNSLYGLCEHNATLKKKIVCVCVCVCVCVLKFVVVLM